MSIKLAANGYTDLYDLLDSEGGVVPLDYIKCPLSSDGLGEVARARPLRPVLLHGWGPGGYSVTQGGIPEPETLRELAPLSGAPWLSVHLHYKPERDGELSRQQLLTRVQDSVWRLQGISGLPVLLENVPWYLWDKMPPLSTDPEFIAESLAVSGADFLCDLAHARVAAEHRGEDIYVYLEALPLAQAREIHISGPRREENGLLDRHLTLQAEDWKLLGWVLARAPQVQILTHEYMGKRPKTAQYTDSHGPAPLYTELLKMAELVAWQPHYPVNTPHSR